MKAHKRITEYLKTQVVYNTHKRCNYRDVKLSVIQQCTLLACNKAKRLYLSKVSKFFWGNLLSDRWCVG